MKLLISVFSQSYNDKHTFVVSTRHVYKALVLLLMCEHLKSSANIGSFKNVGSQELSNLSNNNKKKFYC